MCCLTPRKENKNNNKREREINNTTPGNYMLYLMSRPIFLPQVVVHPDRPHHKDSTLTVSMQHPCSTCAVPASVMPAPCPHRVTAPYPCARRQCCARTSPGPAMQAGCGSDAVITCLGAVDGGGKLGHSGCGRGHLVDRPRPRYRQVEGSRDEFLAACSVS